jgi:hypothetical protein
MNPPRLLSHAAHLCGVGLGEGLRGLGDVFFVVVDGRVEDPAGEERGATCGSVFRKSRWNMCWRWRQCARVGVE